MTFNLTYTRFLWTHRRIPTLTETRLKRISSDQLRDLFGADRLTFEQVNRIQGKEMYSGVQPALTVEDAKRWAGGFYIQQEHRLTGDLTLIGGVQANKIGSLAWNVVPRVGILWNPAAHFTMQALYGGAFRAPSLDEPGSLTPG